MPMALVRRPNLRKRLSLVRSKQRSASSNEKLLNNALPSSRYLHITGANAFAISVGSGSIALSQALIIACFCEFGGAFLLGASTSETIKSGIVDSKLHAASPELLMVRMLHRLYTFYVV